MRLFRGPGTQRARSGDAGGRQRTMRYGPAGAVAALWLRPCRGAMHAGVRDHMAHHLYLIGLPLCLRSLSHLSSQGPQPQYAVALSMPLPVPASAVRRALALIELLSFSLPHSSSLMPIYAAYEKKNLRLRVARRPWRQPSLRRGAGRAACSLALLSVRSALRFTLYRGGTLPPDRPRHFGACACSTPPCPGASVKVKPPAPGVITSARLARHHTNIIHHVDIRAPSRRRENPPDDYVRTAYCVS